jgi:Ca2+-binding RTX toxin-like protein
VGRAGLRRTWTLLLVLGCLIFSSGCGPAGVEAGAGEEAASGTAPPTTSQNMPDGDALVGTAGDDNLRAGGGNGVVRGLEGNDQIYGGEGRDQLYGGPGNDVIDAQDPGSVGEAGRDEISCGPGRDEVLMDANDDEKPRDCEMAVVGSS